MRKRPAPQGGDALGEDLSYVILAAGVSGVRLGLYGLLPPTLRRRGISLPVPHVFRSEDDHDPVENLIAELEKSGFRQSAFESKPLALRPSPAPAARVASQPQRPEPAPTP